MRSLLRRLLPLLLIAFVVSPLLGQFAPAALSVLDQGVGAPMLLMNKGVQTEINLTEEQRNQFAKILQEAQAKYQPDVRKARVSRDTKKLVQVLRDAAQDTRDKVNKAIPDVLKPDQVKRLTQIEIQVNGSLSLDKPEVRKQLKLTDKQQDDIKRVNAELKQNIAGVAKDAANAPLRKGPEALRKARELSAEATRKALATLDTEQKKTWNAMIGDKFDYQMEIPRLGGR